MVNYGSTTGDTICEETGKRCYDKKGAISAKNLRWKEDRIKLREYHCKKNGFDHWHLTKVKPKNNKWEKKRKEWN